MTEPSELNPLYRPAWDSDKRYRQIYGGSGSGKSVYTAQEEVLRASESGEHNILLVRKFKTDIRDSCFALVRKVIDAMGLRSRAKIRRNEMRVTFKNGSQILAVGLDDHQRLKSIVDPTRVWVEEANQISEADFNELNRRLRGETPVNYQITLTYNPEMGRDHWIRRRWFEEGEPVGEEKTYEYEVPDSLPIDREAVEIPYWEGERTFWLRTTQAHNPWVDEEYQETLSEGGKEAEAVYLKGEFYDSDDPKGLIKATWVDEAIERDLDPQIPALGVDVARFGDDNTALVVVEVPVVTYVEIRSGRRTTETAERSVVLADRFDVIEENVVVDTGGLGAGTADDLHERGFDFTPVKYGSSPIEDEIYAGSFFTFEDLRSQMWWHARRLFMNGEVSIDLTESAARRLRSDLTALRYDIKAGRKIVVEPKAGSGDSWGVKSRLGRSPDAGDAFVQAAFAPRLESNKEGGGGMVGRRGEDEENDMPSLVGRR